MSVIADFVGRLKQEGANTVRQRLREWCYDAPDKAGRKRQEVEVTAFFVWLLAWAVSWWRSGEKQMVLVMSVVYRGCAIPVAGAIVVGNNKGAWQPHWLGMLELVRQAIPCKWCVFVLTDRGLYAKWLYQAIRAHGWHPFMRINTGGQYRVWRGVGKLGAPCLGCSSKMEQSSPDGWSASKPSMRN